MNVERRKLIKITVISVFFGFFINECRSNSKQLKNKQIRVERFGTNPLITPKSSITLGENINGPSVIRVPDWVENPLGKYYMYFAHHSGTNIRLAYANDLQGPWHIYEPGTLKLEDAHAFHDHIASPDVHVDDAEKQIRMYFHGPAKARKGQWTGVAISGNGLDFQASAEILGKFYFRVWKWGGHWYALAKNNNEGWGELYRSDNPLTGFQSRGDFLKDMRHAAVMVDGHNLLIFYSRVGDSPERIVVSRVNMSSDWMTWQASEPKEVIKPEMGYEGIEYPVASSGYGPATHVQQLRDPCVFHSDGTTYLFYTISGEMGIGGAILTIDASDDAKVL